jgi:hypothetical protein
MGWAAAIHAQRCENKIKELQRMQQGYSSEDKYEYELSVEGYRKHPEQWEWKGPGSSGYRYIGMKDVED